MNDQNLKASSPSEARERGRKGGIASGASRRRRKTLADTLKTVLSCKIPKGSPLYETLKAKLAAYGLEYEPTVQDIPVLGIIVQAESSPAAFAALRDTIGEKPAEKVEQSGPPLVLSLASRESIEAAKAARAARLNEDASSE